MRVLLVEDGRDNQRLIVHVLQRAGCECEVVDNGQLCLDRMLAPGPSFDAVLMDLQMPVLDGITATRRLRAAGCRVPLVALTANAAAAVSDACLAAGCEHFLTKPIDRHELVRVLGSVRQGVDARS